MESLFDPNPGQRSESDWKRMLEKLVETLSASIGVEFVSTSWFIEDHAGYASSSGNVNIRGPLSPAMWLDACGVVNNSINHGEAAWASADILLFSGGRRVLGPNAREVIRFKYNLHGWTNHGWVYGDCSEWELERFPTDARWQKPKQMLQFSGAA